MGWKVNLQSASLIILGGLVILAIGLITVSVLLLISPRNPSQPAYNGRGLGAMLRVHRQAGAQPGSFFPRLSNSFEFQQADEGVRSIGTNALPVLLRMMGARDSRLMLKLHQLFSRQHALAIPYEYAGNLQEDALEGFWLLGEKAAPAVPQLVRIYSHSSPDTQCLVARALGDIGPRASNAIPVLLSSLKSTEPMYVSGNALDALQKIHSRPDICLPAIAIYIDTAKFRLEDGIKDVVEDTLKAFGPFPTPIIDHFRTELTDGDPGIRWRATNAMRAIISSNVL